MYNVLSSPLHNVKSTLTFISHSDPAKTPGSVGLFVGAGVTGANVGDAVGDGVGDADGCNVGGGGGTNGGGVASSVGSGVGAAVVGSGVGLLVGGTVGSGVGFAVGGGGAQSYVAALTHSSMFEQSDVQISTQVPS